MHKLAEVVEARALMTEGLNWGVWKWLMEKSTVRRAADLATEALAKAAKKTKSEWNENLIAAYREAALEIDVEQGKSGAKRKYEKLKSEAAQVDPKLKAAMRRVKEADDEGQQATDEAEEMFAEAERWMSTGMARQAAQKALESYDLREKAIRRAEEAARKFTTSQPA